MIKHSQNIIINANNQKVWNFLVDFSRSLIFDKHYLLIELPQRYSVNDDSSFSVKAKYLFQSYHLYAKVFNYTPLNFIKIKLSSNKFYHVKTFKLISIQNKTQIRYIYNCKFQ